MEIELLSMRTAGKLSFIEAQRDCPFEIKRIYYIYGEPEGTHRGFHAHKSLKQLLFCPYGSIEILLNNGKKEKRILLDQPEKGLYIYSCLWREMFWQRDNSVLCVLASEYYDESDYIRDYDSFLQYIERQSLYEY